METFSGFFIHFDVQPPSMEPQPFGHGNTATTAPAQQRFTGLQWSHSLSAMETVGAGLALVRHFRPSMEPQPFGHGNVKPPSVTAPAVVSLQWSHSLSAMETVHVVRLGGIGYLPFNGATAFRPWKRLSRR